MGKDGDPEHRARRQVLERPDDKGVRAGHLEPQAAGSCMIISRHLLVGLTLAVPTVIFAGAAPTPAISPGIVYDMGGKFDRSFNQSASDGVERFKKETGLTMREFEITNAT